MNSGILSFGRGKGRRSPLGSTSTLSSEACWTESRHVVAGASTLHFRGMVYIL